jgi:hypothetical protein
MSSPSIVSCGNFQPACSVSWTRWANNCFPVTSRCSSKNSRPACHTFPRQGLEWPHWPDARNDEVTLLNLREQLGRVVLRGGQTRRPQPLAFDRTAHLAGALDVTGDSPSGMPHLDTTRSPAVSSRPVARLAGERSVHVWFPNPLPDNSTMASFRNPRIMVTVPARHSVGRPSTEAGRGRERYR